MDALGRDYFNALVLTPVKRRYYDRSAVDAALVDIRIKADAANRELQALRNELGMKNAEIEDLKAKLAAAEDALVSSQAECSEMINRANAEAESIVSEARIQKAGADRLMEDSRDLALKKVEEFYSRAKDACETQLEELNAMWQRFLCGLEESDVPSDLKSKIGRIADEVREIDVPSDEADR